MTRATQLNNPLSELAPINNSNKKKNVITILNVIKYYNGVVLQRYTYMAQGQYVILSL